MYKNSGCKLQAHRGVSTEAPENTMAAFGLAVKQGYDIIELDPKVTADGGIVVFHDRNLARTARLNGERVSEEVAIAELTQEELSRYDVGEWFSPEFAGERIPSLQAALDFARKEGVEVKVDNVVQSFSPDARRKLFGIIRGAGGKVGVTASSLDFAAEIVRELPCAPVHFDGFVDEVSLSALKGICAGRELTVWLRFDNRLTSWNKNPAATPEYAARVKSFARLGLWILSSDDEMKEALALGADVVETTGGVKP